MYPFDDRIREYHRSGVEYNILARRAERVLRKKEQRSSSEWEKVNTSREEIERNQTPPSVSNVLQTYARALVLSKKLQDTEKPTVFLKNDEFGILRSITGESRS